MIRKTLIVCKDLQSMGGVANYYRVFRDNFKTDSWGIEFFDIGRRSTEYYQKKSVWRYLKGYVLDLARFFYVLASDKQIRIVQFNPSMIPVPIIRDGLLLFIAKAMGRRTIFFFRGWDEKFVTKINSNFFLRLFIACLCRIADKVIVLAQSFKHTIVDWGIREDKIEFTRTIFDGELVEQYNFGNKDDAPRFLFLSRISEDKGVFVIAEAALKLRRSGLDFSLTFVGFGKTESTVARLKEYVQKARIDDIVTFKGYLDGKCKYLEYARSDVFLLPSSHSEGCPNSVLEAMASGLFVISTGSGALQEVVRDGLNGLIVRPKDAGDLYEKMRWCIENLENARSLGRKNVEYAFEHFEAKKITVWFRNLYAELIDGRED